MIMFRADSLNSIGNADSDSADPRLNTLYYNIYVTKCPVLFMKIIDFCYLL